MGEERLTNSRALKTVTPMMDRRRRNNKNNKKTSSLVYLFVLLAFFLAIIDTTYGEKLVDSAVVDNKQARVEAAVTQLLNADPNNNSKPSGGGDSSVDEASKAASFSFIHAFFASLSVIVVSEIGDKTFFIAAIMAMKHPRCTIYMGAMFALGLMTLLSALLGNILTKLIPRTYTYYASSVLFALFGLKMLREGWQMDASDASEEYEEANSALREQEEKESNSLEMGNIG